MRRIGILGVLGAMAVSAIVAATAGATSYNLKMLPELGRCVKVTRGTGEFTGVKCLKSAGGKGSYNWFSGPGATPKFTTTALEPVILQTVKGRLVNCKGGGSLEGEYTGPKSEKVSVIKLFGCATASPTVETCQSNPAKPEEIEGKELEGELGFVPTAPKAGWDLKRTPPPVGAPTVVSFECGSVPNETKWAVEGSVIGRIRQINSMLTSTEVLYVQSAGKQKPENFESGPPLFEAGPTDVLTTKFESGFPPASEPEQQTGLKTVVGTVYEEKLEVKTKCSGATC